MNPKSMEGALWIIAAGIAATFIALTIAQVFPGIIPAQATGVSL